MSDATYDPMMDEAAEPVRAGWRRAVAVFTVLGAAGYVLGRLGARDETNTIPPYPMFFIVMFAPVLALIGFGLWWLIFGGFGRGTRTLMAFGVLVAAFGVFMLAEGEFTPGGPPKGMKMFALLWGVPLTAGITGLVLAVVPAARGWPATLIALAAVAPWLALRNEGVTGAFELDTSARWKPSRARAAEQHLADRATVVPTGAAAVVEASPADWPGFRGADRTGEVPAAAFRGWDGSAPKERWRKDPVGPAWSSFCAAGDFVFTQEQRGEAESVVCYRADTGAEVWARGDSGRHTDWASGSGPRATPTLASGKLFALTASGTLLALKAESGEPVWRVSLGERFGATKPQFGYSTSPLVVGELVFVNPGSPDGPRLVALAAATGETRWQTEPKGTDGYSSPQFGTIAGAAQVLVFNGKGLFGHDPATGRELWHYEWVTRESEPTTVQPLVLPDGRVLIGGGNKGLGTRCLSVTRAGDAWAVAEAWKTIKFTPLFNDVVHTGGFLYGFDTGRLVCLDLSNGSVRWKDGDYGAGQLLLVGDKLLITSEEKGRLACVAARPDEYEELWKVPAVKGKTWNHPAVARGRLFIRNATEMVCFDLPGYKE